MNSDPRNPLTYRGINLLSCCSKIFGNVLNKRLNTYLELNSHLSDTQNGFRKGRSTEDHVFVLNSIVTDRLNSAEKTCVAFIDFAKAFDSINRDLLFMQLLNIGIDGKFYNVIKSMYEHTTAKIRLNNTDYTNTFETFIGTRQGNNNSPLLFSMFIESLLQSYKHMDLCVKIGNLKVNVIAFADDIVLIAKTVEELQTLVNHLGDRALRWRMKINVSKSEVMVFKRSKAPRKECQINLYGETL